jgi:hypothetical protein
VTTIAAIDYLRRLILEAPLAPQPIEPAPPREQRRPIPIGRPPIWCCGIAQTAIGGAPVYLYQDVNGVPRALDGESHDRAGIGSLFAGEEHQLPRLWPGRQRSWAPAKASEELIAGQGRVGIVRLPAGIRAETLDDRRVRSELGRIVRRLLAAGRDPYLVHDLSQAWNVNNNRRPRPSTEVTELVNAVCGAILRSESEAVRV